MAETRKQYLAAGFKTIHHAAIHDSTRCTNDHAIHKAYHYHASRVYFYHTVRSRSSAIQPRKRRPTQHQFPGNQVNFHNAFLHYKDGK